MLVGFFVILNFCLEHTASWRSNWLTISMALLVQYSAHGLWCDSSGLLPSILAAATE